MRSAETELAEAVVLKEGRVLLVRRRDVPVWSLPGGHRDPGEKAGESCVREVFEETGLRVRLERLLGEYRRPFWLSGGRCAIYLCALEGGEIRPGEFEAEVAFFPAEALPAPILYWYPPVIAAARAAEPIPAGASSPHESLEFRSPTLGGFLGSLGRSPRLWLPLARHATRLFFSSRIAQRRATR